MTTAAHLHARNCRKLHTRYCKIFASELLQLPSTGPSAVGGSRRVERKTGKRPYKKLEVTTEVDNGILLPSTGHKGNLQHNFHLTVSFLCALTHIHSPHSTSYTDQFIKQKLPSAILILTFQRMRLMKG